MCEERERELPGECYRRWWGWNAEVTVSMGVVLTAWRTSREASRRPCCGLSWQMGEREPRGKRQPQRRGRGRPVLSGVCRSFAGRAHSCRGRGRRSSLGPESA